jgi:uncharacterized membrane protein
MTQVGYIPLPFFPGVNATTMHIPVIIAGILGGPLVGFFVGLIFGVSSFMRATIPLFSDPLVSVLPRLFIGITSYYTYKYTKNSVASAIVGTATNTGGVLGMIYLGGYLPRAAVLGIAATNGIAEVVVSSIIVYAVIRASKKFTR